MSDIHSICIEDGLWLSVGGNTPFSNVNGTIVSIYHILNDMGQPVFCLIFDTDEELHIPSRDCMVLYK